MRASLFSFITAVLVFPCVLNAQSTLTFARVLDPIDLPATGYVVVNPGVATASVLFRLHDSNGNLIQASTFAVPAGGQLARLGSELFPGVQLGGWVIATSATSNLRGFWLGGDPGFATIADGAEAAPVVSEFVLPIITSFSELDVVNPTADGQAFLIRLYGYEGQEITDPEVVDLPAMGASKRTATSLFTPSDLNLASHAKITCLTVCAGAILVRDFLASPGLAIVNGVSSLSTTIDLNFAHIIQGTLSGLAYSTVVSITNLSPFTQTLTIRYSSDTAITPMIVQRDVPGSGTLRERLDTLFGFTTGFQNGWIRVTSEQPVAGIAIYAESVNRGVAVTPALSRPTSELLLGHIADLNPWWTGIALLNPGVTDASVEIFAIRPDGGLIGRTLIIIPPGAKVARLLSEWVSGTQPPLRTSDGGFVYVRSSVPLYGLQLFFRRDLRVLSNVPAFGLNAGEVFVPPAPPPNN